MKSTVGQIAIYRDGKFIWLDKEKLPVVSKPRAFYINTDTIEPIQSQLDGKFYDSKSALRATYKAAGMIEIGDEQLPIKEFDIPQSEIEEALVASIEEKGGWEVAEKAIRNIDINKVIQDEQVAKDLGYDIIGGE